MRLPVFVGQQAGKVILSGTLPAHEIISALTFELMAVNPNAQRSLARGVGKETTKELLEDDRAHKTPRMRELVGFYLRVMESVEHGDNRQGFFGAVQLVIPARYVGARLRFVEEKPGLAAQWAILLSTLGKRRLATLEAEPQLGETLFEIGDGQGRCFAFYSFQRAVLDALRDKKKRFREKKPVDPEAEEEIRRLEALRERIRKFLSETDVTFVCYASEVLPDGRLIGLGEEAEKRLYIESNALNSQATKEEVIKYESFSPVILALQEARTERENAWMDVEYIEEDSRTLGRKSTKLFTLSALTQAYSYSMLGEPDPITNPNAEMFRRVARHASFVDAYWKRISGVFVPLWLPTHPEAPHRVLAGPDRLAYLERRRQERNVAFQAVFLLALGRLGYALGEICDWNPGGAPLEKLTGLQAQSYKAYSGPDPEGALLNAYDETWARTIMKPRVDGETGVVNGYVFDHSGDKIRATEQLLASMVALGGAAAAPSP